MTASLLIQGGRVLAMGPSRDLGQADLLIEGGRIREIAPTIRKAADAVIDATDCLVLPGLVQAHVHLCQAIFRGLADDLDVVDWLRLRIWPLEQAHDEQSIYDSARLAMAEMIRGGTTSALTMETIRHTQSAFQAILDVGFRAVAGNAMMDRWEPGTEMVGETTETTLAESVRLLREYHGRADGRLGFAFCPRGSRNCSERLWRDLVALAAEHGSLIHSHAAENQAQTQRLAAEGGTDVAYLHRLGATGPRLVLAHCVWVTEAEEQILAETDTRVVHCPSSNMKLASGFARVPEFLQRGITVGLGADGAPCNNNLDMFQEMRLAALIHKPRAGARSMTAETVLHMATLGGARALGLDHEIGSLEVGKRADVILVRRDGLHAQPQLGVDPFAQIVYEHKASDVDTVVIDGQVLLRDGQFARIDAEEIRARATESLRRVLDRAELVR